VESETENTAVQLDLTEPEAGPPETPAPYTATPPGSWPDGFALEIARATRTWIQYGMLGFAVLCIVIGAVRGILGF
jgi:hypothetical protein